MLLHPRRRSKESMDEAEIQAEPHNTPVDPPFSDGEGTAGAISEAGMAEGEEAGSDLYAENRLLSLLFNTQGPVWKYIVRAGLVGLAPSLVMAIFLGLVTGGGGEGMPQFNREVGAIILFVSLVIVSPVIETLFLGFGLWLLSFVTKKPLGKALVSCVLWAGLHSLAASLWGLVVLWPFFVFSCAYLAWRRRSWWHAVGVTCGVHMFQNLLPGILVAVT